MSGEPLIHLRSRELDHLAPFLGLVRHQLAELGGEPGSRIAPSSVKRAFALGSARISLTALLSLLTISGGVPFGAARPYQALAS